MYLYALTLQQPTAIGGAVAGNFSGTKTQEILVQRGKLLELMRVDDSGKLQSLVSVDIFGQIRSIIPFRLTGGSKDYIVVGSDSGAIVILEYNVAQNRFDKVHSEIFGKSGCRRIVPGQFLAADPKGRAVIIGALEKQKLVYILNRDSAAKLTISSPLEAHKSHTLCWDMAGLDVGFENPIFACLETDYDDAEHQDAPEKSLVYYKLDLGLNHVVRKSSETVDPTCNLLVPVPQGGVIVCWEGHIAYRNDELGRPEIRAALPRRKNWDAVKERQASLLITAHAMYKSKEMLFFLLQSELGDVFKVDLAFDEDVVVALNIKYFDTIPPANSLVILKSGFLFAASEFGSHHLYSIQGTGDDDAEPEFELEDLADDADVDPMEVEDEAAAEAADADADGGAKRQRRRKVAVFSVRPLQNLAVSDEQPSLAPVTDARVMDLVGDESPQIYALCGRGANSALRVLRHGLSVTDMAVSDLPGSPLHVWTVKRHATAAFDHYIVVSFVDQTLVLAIGETVEEVSDSGFVGTTATLAVHQIGDDSLLQVHAGGLRHIRADKRVQEWRSPGKKSVLLAACNARQALIALSGGELIYFELDQVGQLVEIDRLDLRKDVACLDISAIPEGRLRARFLAVGDYDNTVRLYSLHPGEVFKQLSMQRLPERMQASSLCMVEMQHGATRTLYLNIGLANGVLLRTVVDQTSGELSDTRTRFAGSRAVRLSRVVVRGQNALLALSTRAWLSYSHHGVYTMTPLSGQALECAASFSSEPCPDGLVGISGNVMRIMSIDRLGDMFNHTSVPLRYTPRKFVQHPSTNFLIILESDHNVVRPEAEEGDPVAVQNVGEDELTFERSFGRPAAGHGRWVSQVRILDVQNLQSPQTHDIYPFESGEAAYSLCTCVFKGQSEVLLIVGTVANMVLAPPSHSGGAIYVFRTANAGRTLQLLHRTPVDGVPGALQPFGGRLLAGVGHALRIYEFGKRKLLRKCELRSFPTQINSIHVTGERIVVGDVCDSFHFVRYRKDMNRFFIFADDNYPRWLTAACLLDYDTMAGADKFGNVFVCRLPEELTDELEEGDPTGSRVSFERSYLNGAPHRAEEVIQYHVGELVHSINKCSLVKDGNEVLLYTTLGGAVGALVPFVSKEDVDFYQHLEMYMRQYNPPLCGRDHLTYRSMHYPVKDTIDGDLCEQYFSIDPAVQRTIAEALNKKESEIMKKLEDMRHTRLL